MATLNTPQPILRRQPGPKMWTCRSLGIPNNQHRKGAKRL